MFGLLIALLFRFNKYLKKQVDMHNNRKGINIASNKLNFETYLMIDKILEAGIMCIYEFSLLTNS